MSWLRSYQGGSVFLYGEISGCLTDESSYLFVASLFGVSMLFQIFSWKETAVYNFSCNFCLPCQSWHFYDWARTRFLALENKIMHIMFAVSQ